MKQCPKCQKEFPDNYGFCLKDGTPLEEVETTVVAARQVEPSPATETAAAMPAKAAQWWQNRWLWGSLAVAVLSCIGLYALLRSNTAAKLDEAIAKNNLLSPPGANAYELYHQLKNEGAGREELAQFESKLVPLVTPRPERLLNFLTTPGGEEPRAEEWAEAAKLLEWAGEMRGNDSGLTARAVYCQGRVAYLSNRRNEAIEIWKRAHELDKSWAVPANSIGLAYNENKDYGTARTHLFQAVERNPNWAFPYNNIGTSFYFQDDFDQAAYYYEKAVECDSKWARPHAWLGSIALRRGNCNRAVYEFEQVLSDNATGTAKMDLGKIQGELNKAWDCSQLEIE
jgi:tetratricopeptide (TPR) repeat protein